MSDSDSQTEDATEFQDAEAEFSMPDVDSDTVIDTARAIQDVYKAIDLCLSNKFFEAEGLVKPWAQVSMYHSLAYSTIHMLQALMTVANEDIVASMGHLRTAKKVAQKHRKQHSTFQAVSSFILGKNMALFNTDQLQAELIHTECTLMKGLLTFLQDESFVSFIKGGLKIRSCYRSYRECYDLIQQHPDQYNIEFICGVKYGYGTFNLIISLLPARLIQLLEFIGFSGNKELGLQLLQDICGNRTFYSSLAALVLLLYHTVIPYIFGLGDGDVLAAEEIVSTMLRRYPTGAFFLYFKGRTEVIKAKLDSAKGWFEQSLSSQQQWPNLHHLCYWELMWLHCFQHRWAEAASFANKLFEENQWSKASYLYFRGSNMLMVDKDSQEATAILKRIPSHKQRIAGRSVPFEKFVVHKSERFQRYGTLFLPAVEVIYVWNGFNILRHSAALLENMLILVDGALEGLSDGPGTLDDRCMALLVRGVCHRYLNRLQDAERSFRQVLEHASQLEELYLVPYSLVELGLCLMDRGSRDEARTMLLDARNNYQKYHLQSRLHFRIHAALTELS